MSTVEELKAAYDAALVKDYQDKLDAEEKQRKRTALDGIERFVIHLPSPAQEEFQALVTKYNAIFNEAE